MLFLYHSFLLSEVGMLGYWYVLELNRLLSSCHFHISQANLIKLVGSYIYRFMVGFDVITLLD